MTRRYTADDYYSFLTHDRKFNEPLSIMNLTTTTTRRRALLGGGCGELVCIYIYLYINALCAREMKVNLTAGEYGRMYSFSRGSRCVGYL